MMERFYRMTGKSFPQTQGRFHKNERSVFSRWRKAPRELERPRRHREAVNSQEKKGPGDYEAPWLSRKDLVHARACFLGRSRLWVSPGESRVFVHELALSPCVWGGAKLPTFHTGGKRRRETWLGVHEAKRRDSAPSMTHSWSSNVFHQNSG